MTNKKTTNNWRQYYLMKGYEYESEHQEDASYFSWEKDEVNQEYQDRAQLGDTKARFTPSKGYEPFELAGDNLTPEAEAKLRLIAGSQQQSPLSDDVVIPDSVPKYDLTEYCKYCSLYFSKALTELDEGENPIEFMEYALDLILYVGWKYAAKCSLASIGDVYDLTRKQVEKRIAKIQRRLDKAGSRSDNCYRAVIYLYVSAVKHLAG
jgi:hypothetical protein